MYGISAYAEHPFDTLPSPAATVVDEAVVLIGVSRSTPSGSNNLSGLSVLSSSAIVSAFVQAVLSGSILITASALKTLLGTVTGAGSSYSDDFNRASLGGDWTTVAYTGWGSMQILSSAYATGVTDDGGQNCGAYYNRTGDLTYPFSRITIYQPGSADHEVGSMLWSSSGCYLCTEWSGLLHLYKIDNANNLSELGSGISLSAAVSGDTIEIRIDPADNHVKTYYNGVLKHDQADTTYRTGLRSAIFSYRDAAGYLMIDAWAGGDLSGGGASTYNESAFLSAGSSVASQSALLLLLNAPQNAQAALQSTIMLSMLQSAALSGSAILAPTGALRMAGEVDLNAAGTLSVQKTLQIPLTVPLSAVSALVESGTLQLSPRASLSSIATILPNGQAQMTVIVTISQTGQVAFALMGQSIQSNLSINAVAALLSQAQYGLGGAAFLSAAATLTPRATQVMPGSLALSSNVAITLASAMAMQGITPIQANGVLLISASGLQYLDAVSLGAGSTQSAFLTVRLAPQAILAGQSSVGTFASLLMPVRAPLSAEATITEQASKISSDIVTLSDVATLLPYLTGTQYSSLVMLSGDALQRTSMTMTLAGLTPLSAQADLLLASIARMTTVWVASAESTIGLFGSRISAGIVAFSAVSQLTPIAMGSVLVEAITLGQGATLGVVATRILNPSLTVSVIGDVLPMASQVIRPLTQLSAEASIADIAALLAQVFVRLSGVAPLTAAIDRQILDTLQLAGSGRLATSVLLVGNPIVVLSAVNQLLESSAARMLAQIGLGLSVTLVESATGGSEITYAVIVRMQNHLAEISTLIKERSSISTLLESRGRLSGMEQEWGGVSEKLR